jgi:hypothetical protein
VHLDFVVSELEAAVSRAIEAGATIEGEIQPESLRNQKSDRYHFLGLAVYSR